jgi:hypothetical protein
MVVLLFGCCSFPYIVLIPELGMRLPLPTLPVCCNYRHVLAVEPGVLLQAFFGAMLLTTALVPCTYWNLQLKERALEGLDLSSDYSVMH